jgi:hypothetical protein
MKKIVFALITVILLILIIFLSFYLYHKYLITNTINPAEKYYEAIELDRSLNNLEIVLIKELKNSQTNERYNKILQKIKDEKDERDKIIVIEKNEYKDWKNKILNRISNLEFGFEIQNNEKNYKPLITRNEVVREYRTALEYNPDDEGTLILLVKLHCKFQKIIESDNGVDKSLSINKKSVMPVYYGGLCAG